MTKLKELEESWINSEQDDNSFVNLHRTEIDGIEETRFLQAMFSSAALIMENLYAQAESFTSEPAWKIKSWLTELTPAWNSVCEKMNTIESDIADRTIYFKESAS